MLVSLLSCVLLRANTPQAEIDTLTARLVEMRLAAVKVDEDDIARCLEAMRPDGSFEGIDYTSVTNNFRAGPHLERLARMAVAYRKEGNRYTGSAELLDRIRAGFDYWLKVRPSSKNWWFNDIGAPQNYMVPLLLLKHTLNRDELLRYAAYLEDKTGNKAHRGKNRTWVSNITIHKGCIEDSYELIRIGFESIASTIRVVPRQGDEGIKIDNSFHQHRPQLYSGGYGMSYVNDLADFFLLAEGTSFSALFDADKRKILSDLLLGGQLLFGYRHTFELGATGRSFTRPNAVSNISSATLDKMMKIDPEHTEDYEAWKKHLEGGPFPKPGNKFFWKSDIMTQHGKNYYLSAKVVSKRTNGTEMINGENLKGYNLPLGATQILVSGEEYRNIYPLWDWCMIPGTTAVQQPDSSRLGGYLFGTNEFAGGVSNGRNGLIAYEHDYRGVKGKKAYFFLNGVMVCLGTDIRSSAPETVYTTLNQCFFGTEATAGEEAGKVRKFRSGGETSGLKWAYHNRVGYLALDGSSLCLNVRKQEGAWRDINLSGSPEKLSGTVFNVWIDHGACVRDGRYAYMVVPDCSSGRFRSIVKRHDYRVVENTSSAQAVSCGDKAYAVVFYVPGEVTFGEELTVGSDKAAVVYIERRDEGFTVWAADPLYREREVTLSLNGQEKTLTFPIGVHTGDTVTQTYLPY